jgi:NADPH:quinone reductase-like Zn-dependent oxidoreductase
MRSAGLNVADCFGVLGKPFPIRLLLGLTRPKLGIPGMDGAGVVEAVGARVTRFKPGDAVFGSGYGTCAELARFPEDHLALKPDEIPFEEAAALPTAGLAALHAIRDCMKIDAGRTLLINGASGGVGAFAVQLAAMAGAEVTAVCSARNEGFVRSLGARQVVDYASADFTRSGQVWDFILDNVENRTLAECRRVLAPRGTLVLNSGTGAEGIRFFVRLVKPVLLTGFVRQRLRRHVSTPNGRDLEYLARLVALGKLRVVIERKWPLEQVASALAHIEEGHTRGRIVVGL